MSEPSSKFDRRYCEALDAAAAVIANKGYHAASTSDIANRLNIKQGSLYYYFKSKEAALEAVCLKGIKTHNQYLEKLVEADYPFAQTIEEIVDHVLASLHDSADYMTVFYNDNRSLPEERGERVSREVTLFHSLYEQIFNRARTRGEIDSELDITTSIRAFVGLIASITNWHQVKSGFNEEMIRSHYPKIFLAGICKQ